jgi:glutaminyl-tRNA synthetase
LYPQKRAKKQRSAITQLTSPHSQTTDFGALFLKKQALMPISNMSCTPGPDSVKAKAAITWVSVADGVKAEVRLTTA